jgi:hypothetical protein
MCDPEFYAQYTVVSRIQNDDGEVEWCSGNFKFSSMVVVFEKEYQKF